MSSIAKVTNAMQVVAAAQHQRLRGRVQGARGFAERSWEVLDHLAATARDELADDPFFGGHGAASAVALVLVSSDRGMAGDFDQAITAVALRFVRAHGVPVRLITVGKSGRDAMIRLGYEIHADVHLGVNFQLEQVTPIAHVLIDGFRDGAFDEVHIAYTQFHGGARFSPTTRRLLPASLSDAPPRQYIYEPDPHTLLRELLPMILRFQVFQAVLESMTAETAARMVAMRTATRNAAELVTHLRSTYNKARQQAITGEMLDIIGGSGAVDQTGSLS